MGGFFYLVLNMGITATLIGLAVVLLRVPLRTRSALAVYMLWLIVLIRLVLPFSIPSQASFYNLISRFIKPIVSIPAIPPAITMTNSVGAADAYFPVHFKSAALGAAFNAAGAVWLAGVAIAAVSGGVLYAFTAARLHRALPSARGHLLKDCAELLGVRRAVGLYVSDEIPSPVVFGLFRPRVVIPRSLESAPETLRYALLHELVHIRRGDNALRAVSLAIACIHWFNPFMWLFFSLASRDMEMACDAGVLGKLSPGERRGYALALAGLASGRLPVFSAAFGKSAVRMRVVGILKYRRLTAAAAAIVASLLFVLAAVLLTNPAL